LNDNLRSLEEYTQGWRLAPGSADLLSSIAPVEWSLGRWEAALEHLRQAARFDPRSMPAAWHLGMSLLSLRRYSEALQALDRGLTFAPANLDLLEGKAMVYLAQGNLPSARAVLQAAPKDIDPTTLVAYMATYWELAWVLDDAQQALLLRLTPNAFDGDRGEWGLVLAQTYALRGDGVRARVYAESSRIALEARLREVPNDALQHIYLGLALAYLGRTADAEREGERAATLLPIAKDASSGAYLQHQLARIYILVNEADKALDKLEPLLKMPYYLSTGWLKIDPAFAPLRGNPRFQRLVRG
jgi:tetratricopeptide (TPR) repeat protein